VLVRNAYSLISAGTESTSVRASGENILLKGIKNPELFLEVIAEFKARGLAQTVRSMLEKYEQLSSLGYSSAGVVLERGAASQDINVGDRVACARARHGNHAEVIQVPRNLLARVPDGVSLEEAAFVALGAIAVQGVRRARVEFGETVRLCRNCLKRNYSKDTEALVATFFSDEALLAVPS
jgi:polar amino acid transport system substrate-binding protein